MEKSLKQKTDILGPSYTLVFVQMLRSSGNVYGDISKSTMM